jgi:multidrug efflux pump subunit AcrA (membrane-fusion protein)
MGKLVIKSPKATQIKKVSVPSGTMVESGTLLIELVDFEERKVISTIQRSIEENRSRLSEVTGPRVNDRIALLTKIVQHRLAALKKTQENYDDVWFSTELGVLPVWRPIKLRHFLSMRTYQSVLASVELEIYKRNIEDSRGVLETVDKLLNKQLEYVKAICGRLLIKAPKEGKFNSLVSAGEPVPIGHILGEIE